LAIAFRVFSGVGAAFVFLMLALYEGHLQTCPVTGRKKFVALTAEQTEKIAKQEFSQARHKKLKPCLLPSF
jgi:hypothetical protein